MHCHCPIPPTTPIPLGQVEVKTLVHGKGGSRMAAAWQLLGWEGGKEGSFVQQKYLNVMKSNLSSFFHYRSYF